MDQRREARRNAGRVLWHLAVVIGLCAIAAPHAWAQCVPEEGQGSCNEDPPEGGGGGMPQCYYDFPDYELHGLAESVRYADYSANGVSLVNGQFVHSETDLEVFDTFGSLTFTRTYLSFRR